MPRLSRPTDSDSEKRASLLERPRLGLERLHQRPRLCTQGQSLKDACIASTVSAFVSAYTSAKIMHTLLLWPSSSE